jgi:DNA-binding phage protein
MPRRSDIHSPAHVVGRLRELVATDGRYQNEIAAAAGMAKQQLHDTLAVRPNPSIESVGRILAALGRRWSDLERSGGFLVVALGASDRVPIRVRAVELGVREVGFFYFFFLTFDRDRFACRSIIDSLPGCSRKIIPFVHTPCSFHQSRRSWVSIRSRTVTASGNFAATFALMSRGIGALYPKRGQA